MKAYAAHSVAGWRGTPSPDTPGDRVTDLDINDDVMLDVSRAFRIACHEAYPGHHVQHVLIDRLFEQRRWPELQLVPGFGPHLLLLEGAAEVGADLALAPFEREQFYRDQLFPAAGLKTDRVTTLVKVEGLLQELLPVVTDVARQYLDGSLTQERAVERLTNDALVANPQGTLAFIERRRARALVYGEGRRVIYATDEDAGPRRFVRGISPRGCVTVMLE